MASPVRGGSSYQESSSGSSRRTPVSHCRKGAHGAARKSAHGAVPGANKLNSQLPSGAAQMPTTNALPTEGKKAGHKGPFPMRSTGPSRAMGASWARYKALSVLRAQDPPTQPISLPAGPDAVSEQHTRAVIDLTLRLGEAMLVTGASVADTTGAVLRVTKAYGLRTVHADITYTSITISCHRGVYRDPITVMRVVARFSMDYSRLERLHTMVRDITSEASAHGHPRDVQEYLRQLDEVLTTPHVYRRGIVTAGFAGMGVGIAALMGGSLLMMAIAAFSTAVIDRLMHKIARLGVSAFFGQVLGSMVAAGVAAVLLAARTHFPNSSWLWEIRPSLVVVSGIVVLLAGSGVVAAAQDTLDGFYVTASARTYEVILLTSGIVAGVLAVLSIAKYAGVRMFIMPPEALAANPWVQVVAAATIAGSFAVIAYCGPVATAVSVIIGGLSWLLYWFVTATFEASQPLASGLAVFAIGLFAPFGARRLRVPSIAITTASIVPLMPGLLVYKGIMFIVEDHNGSRAAPALLMAALVGMALAVGVSLGTLLGRQLMATETSVTAKVLRRTVADS